MIDVFWIHSLDTPAHVTPIVDMEPCRTIKVATKLSAEGMFGPITCRPIAYAIDHRYSQIPWTWVPKPWRF